jgi:catechol 2,3-dioxygenase-like lactoylglutathione lyase family enzyme
MKNRVTGIGGIFFKSENPKAMKEWYSKHLRVGEIFKWYPVENAAGGPPAQTVWSPFKKDTDYFAPSEKPFMLNYRVENLEELLKVLADEGVKQVGEMQVFPYGKFAWILDPEGNKVELWEPVD